MSQEDTTEKPWHRMAVTVDGPITQVFAESPLPFYLSYVSNRLRRPALRSRAAAVTPLQAIDAHARRGSSSDEREQGDAADTKLAIGPTARMARTSFGNEPEEEAGELESWLGRQH